MAPRALPPPDADHCDARPFILVGMPTVERLNRGETIELKDVVLSDADGMYGALERLRLEAQLEEAKRACHDHTATPHARFNPVGKCWQCERIAELETALAAHKP